MTQAIWFSIISDVLVNLAAGWIGAVIVIPIIGKRLNVKWWVLPINIGFAIISLVEAFFFKELS